MTEREIWDFLAVRIGNPYGVAGLMGNLYAESGLRADDLEGRAAKRLGMTDAEYTAAVDGGSYPYDQFVNDRAGYGLAQWTHPTRKAALYCAMTGFSIGDTQAQMRFLYYELACQYDGVLFVLANANSVREASDAVLHGYERPKNQSEAVEEKRARFGQRYFDQYAKVKGAESVGKIGYNALIADFRKMYDEKWGYIFGTCGEEWTQEKQDKATNATTVKYGAQWIGHRVTDCSGAFTAAYKNHGKTIYHGVNRIAREYIVALLPISEAKPGMAAFKAHKPGEQGYDLPGEFKQGKGHYNGDLTDYYHIGLVDSDPNYVLNSQGTRTGFVRGNIADNWHFCAYLKDVDYSDAVEPTGEPLYYATLKANSGKTVNLRRGPSGGSARISMIPLGTTVAVMNEFNADWAEVSVDGMTGYMMRAYLYPLQPGEDATGDAATDIETISSLLDTADQAIRKARELLDTSEQAIRRARELLEAKG